MRSFCKSVQTIVLALCFLCSGLNAQQLAPQSPTTRAAQLLGVEAESLSNVEIQEIRFQDIDVTVTCVKALDTRTGKILSTVRDAAGTEHDLSSLKQAELAARVANPELKLERELREAIASDPQAKQRVGVWLSFDATQISQFHRSVMSGVDNLELSVEAHRALESQVTEFAIARHLEITAPFEGLMNNQGMQIAHVSTAAPLILADLNATEIRELAANPLTDRLYLCDMVFEDHNVPSMRTHRTDRVHEYGVTGTGIRVAVNENNGIDPACPHLNVAGWFNAGTPNPDAHVHGTSGNIASQLASRLGSSPDVQLYSANAATYGTTDIIAALDWVATQNIDVTNMSWGGQQNGVLRMIDRYLDYQFRFFADNYVASAGNSGNGTFVGSPAQGWNTMAIGGMNIQGDMNWTGDNLYTSSATVDPTTGCEKPNLVASAVNVDTLGDASLGWLRDNYSGTSFAAPFVTANMANLMMIDGTARTPEPAMAAMMATAWHNIDGASRLSENDGAGGLHGLAAYRCGNDSRIRTLYLNTGSFSTNGYYTTNIQLTGGDRARVCIAWAANADSGYTTTMLDADLDLAVYQGAGQTSGTSMGFSSSFNNNFEIIEFTPPTTGTYTVRINDYRFDGTSERVGVAWSQKYEDTSYARMREYTSENSATTGPTMGNTSYYMDIDAPGSPSAPYIAYPSATPGTGLAFSNDIWLPMGVDIWTDFWLMTLNQPGSLWNGSLGTLSSSGTTLSHRMSIPVLPPAVGFDLTHTFWTGETGAGYPGDFKETSEVHSFTFWPTGTVRQISDDGSYAMALGFSFPFFGNTFTQLGINANGNITLGGTDSDLSESQAEFLGNGARIAACWDDLEPDENGAEGAPTFRTRLIGTGPNRRAIIEFIDVGEYQGGVGANGANTFRYTLYENGRIDIEYRDMDLDDCIVGISPGTNISSAGPIDLSKNGRRFSSGATYEVFNASNPFDLAGPSGGYMDRVSFIPSSPSATSYRLDLFDTRY